MKSDVSSDVVVEYHNISKKTDSSVKHKVSDEIVDNTDTHAKNDSQQTEQNTDSQQTVATVAQTYPQTGVVNTAGVGMTLSSASVLAMLVTLRIMMKKWGEVFG
jgi:hypothetical protein